MNATTLAVHWHDENQPIYSVDFQSHTHDVRRLVTSGGDNNIRIWFLLDDNRLEYLSTLSKHTQAVNVVRFNSDGSLLASASDDGSLIIWRKLDNVVRDITNSNDDVESWQALSVIRSSNAEINDICWSSCNRYIATGSMDNTLRVYEIDGAKYKLIASASDHSHYIQGITFDPLGSLILSQSVDRLVIVYTFSNSSLRLHSRMQKLNNSNLFFAESLQSFFRRLTFSPDGAFIITPAGLDEKENPAIYAWSRNNFSTPAFIITGLLKPAVAVTFLNIKFKSSSPSTLLPYYYYFAIATKDSIYVYSTESFEPISYVSNLHYLAITDLRWDHDGLKIIVSSADGFCSVIRLEESLFGEKYLDVAKANDSNTVLKPNASDAESLELTALDPVDDSAKLIKGDDSLVNTNPDTSKSQDSKPAIKAAIIISESTEGVSRDSSIKSDSIIEKGSKPSITDLLTPKVIKKEKKRLKPTLIG